MSSQQALRAEGPAVPGVGSCAAWVGPWMAPPWTRPLPRHPSAAATVGPSYHQGRQSPRINPGKRVFARICTRLVKGPLCHRVSEGDPDATQGKRRQVHYLVGRGHSWPPPKHFHLLCRVEPPGLQRFPSASYQQAQKQLQPLPPWGTPGKLPLPTRTMGLLGTLCLSECHGSEDWQLKRPRNLGSVWHRHPHGLPCMATAHPGRRGGLREGAGEGATDSPTA